MEAVRLNGSKPREIPALDGVRAVAALSVLFYHAYQLWTPRKTLLFWDITIPWYYAQTGVHLFFVLSGFLLFLPYARAMLAARPLPSARRFYRRRALRILPVYWACLAVLSLVEWQQLASWDGVGNVVAHIFLVHDAFEGYNRTIEGPFWTLAIEVQFYLLLPLLALGIARVVGTTRSALRLALGVVGVMAGAFALRGLGAFAQNQTRHLDGAPQAMATIFVHTTMGMQGKFLEVFATGMLGAVAYVVVSEQQRLHPRATKVLGVALLGLTVATIIGLMPLAHERHIEVPPYTVASQPGDWLSFFGPFLVGLGYGLLVMAVLWGGGVLRAIFTFAPLRFVGLMSYSLYLWHLPVVHGFLFPPLKQLPWQARVAIALGVALVSYWLLERPILRRRERWAASHVGTAGERLPEREADAAAVR